MAQQQNTAHTDNTITNGKDKKSSEPLFGPSIGAVRSGPPWTICSEKKVVTDELTPEVVNSWIEKSKEVTFFFSLHPASLRWRRFIFSFFFKTFVLFIIFSSRPNLQLLYKLLLILSVHHYASRHCLLHQMIYPRSTQPINTTTVSNSNMIAMRPSVGSMFMSISRKIILMPLQHHRHLY